MSNDKLPSNLLFLPPSNFDNQTIKREKKRYIASITQSETMPESIASKAFMKVLYGEHPYALPGSGEVETIKNIGKKYLPDFYKNNY